MAGGTAHHARGPAILFGPGDHHGAEVRCTECDSAEGTERAERTARGYQRFRCRARGKQFNERSGGILYRTQYPSDVIALVVFWPLRYKLSLRDLPEMFLVRGIEFSSEAVRDWEAKLTPALIDSLRRQRQGRIGRGWYVDETYIEVQGRWCYLYRAIDRHGALVDRDPRHEGGESVLSIGQDGDWHHPGVRHHGWARQLPTRDPD